MTLQCVHFDLIVLIAQLHACGKCRNAAIRSQSCSSWAQSRGGHTSRWEGGRKEKAQTAEHPGQEGPAVVKAQGRGAAGELCVSQAACSTIHKLLEKKHLMHTQLTWPVSTGLVGAEQRCCCPQELLGGGRIGTAAASSLPMCPEAGRTACNLDAVGTQPGAPQEREPSSFHRVGFRVF